MRDKGYSFLFLFLFFIGALIMSASTGSPDFNQNLSFDQTAQVIDLGEVANRINRGMGSRSRSGSWLWGDDFANFAAGQYGYSGAAPVADPAFISRPGAKQSLKITTGAASGNAASINKLVTVYPTRMGIENLVQVQATTDWTYVLVMVWNKASNLGPNGYTARLQIKRTANVFTLSLREDVGSAAVDVVEINPLEIPLDASIPHYIKMVADFTTGMYGTVWVDHLRFDFSAKPIAPNVSAPANTGMYMTLIDQLTTNSNNAISMYVNDLIFTKDEP